MSTGSLRGCLALAVAAAALFVPSPVGAQPELQGVPALAPLYYTQNCARCHDSPETFRAPSREALRQRTPEAIYDALTKGVMVQQGGRLSNDQKRVLAAFLSGRPAGSTAAADAEAMPNRCRPKPFGNPLQGPLWNGWGADVTNSRFQPKPELTAGQVSTLDLKWAFAFPNASSAYTQPLVAGGRVYAGSDGSFVYALDARSGCVYWSHHAEAGVRTALSIGRIEGPGPGAARYALYFGDIQANVYALNPETGALLWTQKADMHKFARITGAPALHAGKLYVPVASLEEAAGGDPTYPCCTFRGSLVAYEAATGKLLWKTYTITTPPAPTKKTSTGVQLYGPSGGAIWSAPAIDEARKLVYVTTGDAYSSPADVGTDAVMAIEMETGHVRWTRQLTANDVWLVGCTNNPRTPQSETCPDAVGPDADFGSNASIHKLPTGRSIVVAQQKSAIVWGLDPDKDGEIVWKRQIGGGGPVQFGHATAGDVGYFAAPDVRPAAEMGGLFALKLATGERVWRAAPECAAGDNTCSSAHLSAVTAIPGVVFASTADGVVRAYDAADGRVIWRYNTTREYETVNRTLGKGGSLSGPGATVAGGMVFVNSGYAAIGGNGPGNVLLAFSPR